MAYTLTLTEDETGTIAFVGSRYAWADSLLCLEAGENQIAEHEAWEIAAAFESDMEGGHSPFPMLNPASTLWDKLQAFWDGIV
jgi:hypothetical protein